MDKKSQDGDWELRKARRVETLWEGGDVSWEGLGAWKQRWELPEERQGGRALVSSSTGNNKLLIKEKLEGSLLGEVQLRVKLGNLGWQKGPGKGGRVWRLLTDYKRDYRGPR